MKYIPLKMCQLPEKDKQLLKDSSTYTPKIKSIKTNSNIAKICPLCILLASCYRLLFLLDQHEDTSNFGDPNVPGECLFFDYTTPLKQISVDQ